MRNFSSSCLLPWLPVLEYRQLNRAVWFFSPSCHVWVPLSLMFTKPWFRSQYVLTWSYDLTLHSSLPHVRALPPIQAKLSPQQNASPATGEEPRQRTAFPSTDNITSFFKTPMAFYTRQRIASRIFVSSCLSGRKVFWACQLVRQTFKKLLPPGI